MTTTNYFGNMSTLAKRGAVAALFGSMTAILVSCGGSGTTGGNPLTNGTLAILPKYWFLYANTPTTINIAGGMDPTS
ncbi:MAG: hypothetical protein IPP88_16945 [Betaproteobacteria bacterium]|nr:hypothetical protein [Betaproteobacteria bacterium]